MANFDNFLDKLQQRYGFEYFGVFTGVYEAIVTANNDPEQRGRVQVKVPTAGHRTGLDVWVLPSFALAGGDMGMFFPPEVGATVRVSFENGNPAKPRCYWGGFLPQDRVPTEFRYSDDGRPHRRGIVTRAGHVLSFCDERDNESVRLIWHKPADDDPSHADETLAADRSRGEFALLSFEPDGSLQIANKSGTRLDLDATGKKAMLTSEQGNYVALDEDGVKVGDAQGDILSLMGNEVVVLANATVHVTAPTVSVKAGTVLLGDGAVQSAVLGELFQVFFNAHTHPTGTGPSGVPTAPLPGSVLSQAVKVKA